jgi:hypothetical protein
MSSGPAARLVREAEAPLEVICADGRRIGLRRMNVLDRLRLFKAVGPELAGNDAYLGIAYLACAVSTIDNVPVPWPGNEQQIESLVGRLGDDGIEAVANGFVALDAQKAENAPGN